MSNEKKNNHKKKGQAQGITAITVCGYKSISKESTIEIRPLTILAGANSSGKSSIMQPLLLLKQTLESSYNPPGPLVLDGSHIKFNSVDQFLSKFPEHNCRNRFLIDIHAEEASRIRLIFKKVRQDLEISEMSYQDNNSLATIRPDMTHEEIMKIIPEPYKTLGRKEPKFSKWKVKRFYAFLHFVLETRRRSNAPLEPEAYFTPPSAPYVENNIRHIIHVPGLRGNPERAYPATMVASYFRGTFPVYVASVIHHWQESRDDRLNKLKDALQKLELSSNIETTRIGETSIEIKVGRLLHSKRGGAKDLVSIADVGFGVSQSLPVLVSLLTAKPGQLVYIEQPEIHLHPRAQVKMADLLAEAAKRGVRVVAETHSALLLLAVQTLVAEGKISPDLIKLHWFERDSEGITKVPSRDLDKDGSFGDWPQDFGSVELEAEKRYLDSAEKHI